MPPLPLLILASTSPYRRALLSRLGLPFEVHPPLIGATPVDETPQPGETAAHLALRLATAKAHAVSTQYPHAIVIGSDQVASLGDHLINKPGNFERAQQQLRQLSGQEMTCHSALAVTNGLRTQHANILTHCRFRDLSEAAIDAYLHAETPFDVTGSVKAEGLGIALMSQVRSDDPTALIGLPLMALTDMLVSFGLDPLLLAAAKLSIG